MNNVEIIYDIANLNDIPELVRLRILYMIDDFGSITDEERAGMEKGFVKTLYNDVRGKSTF